MMIRKTLLAFLLLGLPALSMSAGSWWNGDWKFRKEITLDTTSSGADIGNSVANVPVLLRLSLANFSYFNDTKPDGSDLRVIAADDKTPLKFHVEKYDVQNQMAFIWVQIPQLAAEVKSEKIYLYYGNPDAPSAADAAGTFDPDQALVLEFAEPSGLPLDSTAYKNNPATSTATPSPASLIGSGVAFSGAQGIHIASSQSLRLMPNQGFTASAWVKVDAAQAQADVIALVDHGHELSLGINGLRAFARFTGAAAPVNVTQAQDLTPGQWHHLALTAGAGQLTLYVDGLSAGQAPVTLLEIGGDLAIGSSPANTNFLTGEIDEVGVARTARGADWIKTVARDEGPTGNLIVYGTDGQKEGGGQSSYFVTILKNLTIDGWFVIGICMFMLFIALIIMALKTFDLGRVERANRRFLSDYYKLSEDAFGSAEPEAADARTETSAAGALLSEDTYGVSTLFALYRMGVAELTKRHRGHAAGAQVTMQLSPQSVEAIRASMDATQTRLQQRLSARMVLLTIAISGGPFLGLLGTVIGVMITFAAIAASGDVNVNAIAPGTAAALAATVAGLSVAIPCLFGYNWLNTRIKAIGADNRVFLDEFVARLAEKYS